MQLEIQMRKGQSCVQLLPFDVGRDLPMLRTWLTRPHVARWWGDADQVLAVVCEHCPDHHALIAVDGKAVGYLCWQNPQPKELDTAGLTDLPADLIDVDILIGELDFIGRGVGPQTLRLLLDRLRSQGVSCVGLAADVDNRRAVRAYAKAGFQPYEWFQEEGQNMCYFIQTLD